MNDGRKRDGLQVIGFDLDDTLWDVRPVIIAAEEKLSNWLTAEVPGFNYDPVQLRQIRGELVDVSPDLAGRLTELRRRVLTRALSTHLEDSAATSTAEAAMEVFLAARNEIELFEGAWDAIHTLKQRYVLGALSNGNADIHRVGLGEHFDFAFSAEQVGAPKPHSALFEAALEHAGVDPHQMVYVGDDPHLDVDAANRLGLRTVWVKKSDDAEPGETDPDHVIRHVRELPDAIRTLDV